MAKEITWRGKTEEELRKLDVKQFLPLTTSRVRRSLSRGFTPAQKEFLKTLKSGKDNVKTHCRDLIIIPEMLTKTIQVHSGKEYVPLKITAEMLGHYLGEFAQTRKSVTHSAAGIGATRSSKAISAR